MPRTNQTPGKVGAANLGTVESPPAPPARRIRFRAKALPVLNLKPPEVKEEYDPADEELQEGSVRTTWREAPAAEPLIEIRGFSLPPHGGETPEARTLVVADPAKGQVQPQGTIPTWVANALVKHHGELYAEIEEGKDDGTAT